MDKKILHIKERVLQIADYYGVQREKFFKNLGFSYANFKGEQRKSGLNSDSVAKILSMYPEVNPVWLLTGEGYMVDNGKSNENSDVVSILKEQVREQTIYIKSLIRQLDAMKNNKRLIKNFLCIILLLTLIYYSYSYIL